VLGETSSSNRWRVAGDGAAACGLFGRLARGDFADVVTLVDVMCVVRSGAV
jgi:hypothetical protein